MALKHYVNGELLDMTPEEEAAFIASRGEPERRKLPKSTVTGRLIAMGLAATVKAALDADPVAWARWVSPDWPEVYADDEGLISFLAAIGLTEQQITSVLAP